MKYYIVSMGLKTYYMNYKKLNNIYEQTDSLGNKRYIVDATINSKNNYYTVNIVVDFVVLNGEI